MKCNFIILVCLPAILWSEIAASDPLPEGIAALNAFSLGTGYSGVAGNDDPSSVYWNPAVMGVLNQLAVDLSLAATTLESPGSWSFLMTNSNMKDGGRAGLALIRHHVWRDTTAVKAFQTNIPLAYGFSTGEFPVGVALKLISESVDGGEWHLGSAVDLGMAWITPSGVRMGLAVHNAARSNLGAFERATWLGAAWSSYSDASQLFVQVKIDQPFKYTGLTRNYGFGFTQQAWSNAPRLRFGYLRRGDKGWLSAGISNLRRGGDSHIDYTITVNPDGWGEKVHLLTYGYMVSGGKPSLAPIPGTR